MSDKPTTRLEFLQEMQSLGWASINDKLISGQIATALECAGLAPWLTPAPSPPEERERLYTIARKAWPGAGSTLDEAMIRAVDAVAAAVRAEHRADFVQMQPMYDRLTRDVTRLERDLAEAHAKARRLERERDKARAEVAQLLAENEAARKQHERELSGTQAALRAAKAEAAAAAPCCE